MDYYGIYWTFPVPRIGFASLGGVEDAARASITIRYQRERIRREVVARRGTLAAERAFLEGSPDRGTAETAAEIAAALAKRPDLTPMLVDFAEVMGWRSHSPLRDALPPNAEFVTPDPLPIDGKIFDPHAHFREWAQRTADHVAGKSGHRARILAALQDAPLPHADHLNAIGLRTHTGRVWTRDNLRKFLKA